jgi:DNA-binding LacI/PurR family transcriptional regulator
VTGFDGVEIPGDPLPKLTTAAIPLEELGAEAARMIAWRMQHPGEPPRRVTIEARLVDGETAGRVAEKG